VGHHEQVSIEKSESGPLEQNSCKMVEEFYAARPWIETRQSWVKLCVGGFQMRGTRATVPHSVRARAALLNKSVGVVDKINESIANIVVDRDCEPQRCDCASKGQTT